MIQLVRAIILVVGLVGATVSATPTKKCAYKNYRLPKHIVPRHYDLLLSIDMKENKCDGRTKIQLEVTENMNKPRDIIVLNVHPDVKVTNVNYLAKEDQASPGSNLRSISVIDFCKNEKNELLVIQLDKGLDDGARGELEVWFEAKIRDDGTGIYKTEYKTQTGVDSYQISTDFKPNKARRAFPCFDEPAFKATFEITLNYDPEMDALSNTDPFSTGNNAGYQTRTFMRTPEMSTYLVAFVIGKFHFIESVEFGENLKIRAFTQEGKSQQAEVALQTAVGAISYLEWYFDIQFPLKKLDLVSVVQHNSVETENWGLIVVNETSFLFDPLNMSPISKGDVAKTIFQSVTKQWFGNLVTLEWWDDLWLQEGFARWMANFLTDQLYPELQWEKNYLIETQQQALKEDSEWGSPQIRFAVNRTSINRILDDFIFVKSVAVIRMLHDDYVGLEHFQDGIRRYLDENKHRNVDARELWETLTTLSGKPVENFIRSWTEHPGHPVVPVKLSTDGRKLILEQKIERPGVLYGRRSQRDWLWVIPVTISLSDGQHRFVTLPYIFDQPSLEVDFPDWFDIKDNSRHWLKVNAYSRGFYRAHHNVRSILPRLRRPCDRMHRTYEAMMIQIDSTDKIGLIDDFEASIKIESVKSLSLLKFLGWFNSELDGSVLGRISRVFSHSQIGDGFWIQIFDNAYSRIKLSSPLFREAGTSDRMSAADGFGLVTAYSILLELNHMPLVEEALLLFETYANRVAPTIRELVYKAVALHGSDEQRINLQSFLEQKDNCQEEIDRIKAALELVPGRQDSAGSSSQGVRERPEAVLPDRIKRRRIA